MDLYNHKGELDRQWYLRKLNRALRDSLPEIVTHETIIGARPNQRIRIAVQRLEEPHFRYESPPSPAGGHGQGIGGADGGVVWIEMTTDELMDLWLEDLKLPRMENKPRGVVDEEEDRFDDVTRRGPLANLDKRRSFYAARSHGRDYLAEEDLRFRSWKTHTRPITSAVVTLVRDASGSMDETKRYLSKSAAWWIVRWIQRQYRQCELVYLLHTTEPVRVEERDFFSREITGGTAVLSTFQAVADLWDREYPPSAFNHYFLHFSDGEIWSAADGALQLALQTLVNNASLLGYFEVQGYRSRRSPLWKLYEATARESTGRLAPVRLAEIHDREDVLGAIRTVIADSQPSS